MNDREYGNGWISNTVVVLTIALAFVLAIESARSAKSEPNSTEITSNVQPRQIASEIDWQSIDSHPLNLTLPIDKS